MRDIYEVLELERGQERSEYERRYNELKARYREDMFLSGEAGNEAARKLTELESAYAMLLSELERNDYSNEFGDDIKKVDELIIAGKYDEAQTYLDNTMNRNAEWHYYQSCVFYKREWMSESRKHLVIACQMEPNNQKYRENLERFDAKMGNPNYPPEQLGNTQNVRDEGCFGNSLTQCCMLYCCADCCADCCCNAACG